MLVIVSDLHLGDGTTAASIPASAFELFAKRLNEAAYFASLRSDDSYRPITELDVVLMGDILDPLHSTRWLSSAPGEADLRPWSDSSDPRYARKLLEVTRAILDENQDALAILRACASGELISLRADPDSQERIPIKARFHYMVGNHDWYYRLAGAAFDDVRREIIDRMGLANPSVPFPHNPSESPILSELLGRYGVVTRHGDHFDKFNFDSDKGRNFASLGDVFTMEVCNRFPVAVQAQFGDDLPAGVVDSLRRITNIRPALATPLWVSGQLKQHAGSTALEAKLKQIWDDITDEFLELDAVREADKAFRFDLVDAMQVIVKVSKGVSFSSINDVVVWVQDHMWPVGRSFANQALAEPAVIDKTASFVVYGHTHQHEVIPLDSHRGAPGAQHQVYLNSGTWHSYFDLAIRDPREQKFVRHEALTYVTFYTEDECGPRRFEAWSGVYG